MTGRRLLALGIIVVGAIAGLVVFNDSRIPAFTVWGLGCVVAYGISLAREIRTYRLHHDARANRDLLTAAGLFLTALGAAASVWLVLFGEAGTGIRPFVVAISLGSFFGVGLILATSSHEHDPANGKTSG